MQMTEAYELYKNKEITLEEYKQMVRPSIEKDNRWKPTQKPYRFKNIKYLP